MKWEIEKNIATVQELNQQIRYQNEQIYKLNEDVIDRNERIKKVEEANKVLTTGQEYLQSSYQ